MAAFLGIILQGIEFQLFAARAAYCPAHDSLFIADAHLGKDATFRRHGFPVPTGSSHGTLRTISALLAETNASQLVILGDLFHDRSSLSTETVRVVEDFFDEHSSVEFTLVRGNHDARLGELPDAWPIRTIPEGRRMGSIVLAHHPAPLPAGAELLLCGHVHPAVRVGTSSHNIGKFACFWYASGRLVFPAIGEFTGTHIVHPQDEDRTWLVADNEIVEL